MARTYEKGILLNLFVIFPCAAFLFLFGHDIVEIVFERGAFSAVDTSLAGRALQHYSYGLIGFAAVRVTVPLYYALGDSKSPMRVSIATVALNLLLYYPCIRLFEFAGLAAATSLAALFNFAFLLYRVPRMGLPLSLPRLVLSMVRLALAAVLAVWAARFLPIPMLDIGSKVIEAIISLAISVIVAAIVYVALCFAMGVNPLRIIRPDVNKSSPHNQS